MKRLILALSLVAGACNLSAESNVDQAKLQLQANIERDVTAQPLVLAGKEAILMGTLGDAAAPPILALIAGGKPLTANQIKNAVTLIHVAFASPERIKDSADKSPNQTLKLLEALSGSAPSPAVSAQIEALRQFVQAQTAK